MRSEPWRSPEVDDSWESSWFWVRRAPMTPPTVQQNSVIWFVCLLDTDAFQCIPPIHFRKLSLLFLNRATKTIKPVLSFAGTADLAQ